MKSKIKCKNPECGKEIQFTAPAKPGTYGIVCSDCGFKTTFRVKKKDDPTEDKPQAQPEEPHQDKIQDKSEKPAEMPDGLQNDGTYRITCSCGQKLAVPPSLLKPGHNSVSCPKCKDKVEFEAHLPITTPVLCKTCGTGHLDIIGRGDGIFTCQCDNENCDAKYTVLISDNKIVKVTAKTERVIPAGKTDATAGESTMTLVTGNFFKKKTYDLHPGTHYIGRIDELQPSDFQIDDSTVSRRSVRIDATPAATGMMYKLTVEHSLNPVYHNNTQLENDDVVYLVYGDTIRMGKTLIKVKKS